MKLFISVVHAREQGKEKEEKTNQEVESCNLHKSQRNDHFVQGETKPLGGTSKNKYKQNKK
jgi:hypothetical protein